MNGFILDYFAANLLKVIIVDTDKKPQNVASELFVYVSKRSLRSKKG